VIAHLAAHDSDAIQMPSGVRLRMSRVNIHTEQHAGFTIESTRLVPGTGAATHALVHGQVIG
jgi:hypothetical protein